MAGQNKSQGLDRRRRNSKRVIGTNMHWVGTGVVAVGLGAAIATGAGVAAASPDDEGSTSRASESGSPSAAGRAGANSGPARTGLTSLSSSARLKPKLRIAKPGHIGSASTGSSTTASDEATGSRSASVSAPLSKRALKSTTTPVPHKRSAPITALAESLGVVVRREQAATARTRINVANVVTSGTDDDALTTSEPGQRLVNVGRLTTTGDLADGISADAEDVAITNFAPIDTSGLGAAGIIARGGDAHIVNFGSVVTRGPSGEEDFSEGITAVGDRFRVSNFGTVRVEGDFSSAMSGLGDDGVLVNYGRAESTANDSSLIAVIGDGSQAVNAGRATIGANTAAVFALGEDAAAQNFGSILGTGHNAVGVEGVITNTRLTNTGRIRIAGDASNGIAGLGDGHQLTNYGIIEMTGSNSIGMSGRGIPIEGVDPEGDGIGIANSGRIVTAGQFVVGAALGLNILEGGVDMGLVPTLNGTITNTGAISTRGDGSAGVFMAGEGNHLVNSGQITSDGGEFHNDDVGSIRAAAVAVVGNGTLIENTKTGAIRSKDADSAAVELNVAQLDGLAAADTSAQLDNFGRITAPGVAVLGGAGQESVINHGRIDGDIDLGEGDDSVVFAKGSRVNGEVALGGGDDRVRAENGSGVSRIADFTAGDTDDAIEVSGQFSNLEEVKAHAERSGDDIIIRVDRNTVIVLENVELNALTDADFEF